MNNDGYIPPFKEHISAKTMANYAAVVKERDDMRFAILGWVNSTKRILIANKNPYNEEYFDACREHHEAKLKLLEFLS